MIEDHARKLATRIIDTWPNGPKAYIWRDVLLNLDANIAADTYRHIAETADRITIGIFKSEYDRRIRAERGDQSGIRWRGDEIGFGEYMARLQTKVGNGESEAIEELANWERWMTRSDTNA